jgi:hypothetical protein
MFLSGKDLFMYRLNKVKDFIFKAAFTFAVAFGMMAMLACG